VLERDFVVICAGMVVRLCFTNQTIIDDSVFHTFPTPSASTPKADPSRPDLSLSVVGLRHCGTMRVGSHVVSCLFTHFTTIYVLTAERSHHSMVVAFLWTDRLGLGDRALSLNGLGKHSVREPKAARKLHVSNV
jgi:hypothetical protein